MDACLGDKTTKKPKEGIITESGGKCLLWGAGLGWGTWRGFWLAKLFFDLGGD